MPEESNAIPLTSWLGRLERKVDDLEKDVAEGKIERLGKGLATCDAYLKKLYARAKEHVFHTTEGPQAIRDLARLKVRLERLRKKVPYRSLFYGTALQETILSEQLA
jgi:hypothetical protein